MKNALVPLGRFADGEYPWALSVNDLRTVAESLELPSQLFDYLRRRYEGRCCMKVLLWVVRFGPPFSSPQEPHRRDAVEGSSHV